MIVDYITKFQNNYAFNFLFTDTFVRLLEKGIDVKDLCNSDIFCHVFEVDDWPIVHTDNTYLIRPYNDSIFKLRGKYQDVFNEKPAN
jgi:hypothetical protein